MIDLDDMHDHVEVLINGKLQWIPRGVEIKLGEAMERYNPYTNRFEVLKEYGTAASGNWGHSGRPGEVGGSGPGGGRSGGRSEEGFRLRAIPADVPIYEGPMPNPLASSSADRYKDKSGNIIKERREYYDKVAEHIVSRATPVGLDVEPRNIMLGGVTASGKSTLLKTELQGQIPKNAVRIDADEIKSWMPDYREAQMSDEHWRGAAYFVHDESSIIADRALALATSERYNTIFDGTGDGEADKMNERLSLLSRNGGGGVDMVYVSIPVEESVKAAEIRAGHSRRWVPEEVIRSIHPVVTERFNSILKSGKFPIRSVKLYKRDTASSTTFEKVMTIENGKTQIFDKKAFETFQSYGAKK